MFNDIKKNCLKCLYRQSRKWVMVTAVAWLVIGILAIIYFGAERYKEYFPQCIFYKITNLYCPGCGTTRGIYRLLHGDFYGAWRSNGGLFVFLLIALGWYFSSYPQKYKWSYWVIIGLLFIYFILRNLPGSFLAVY